MSRTIPIDPILENGYNVKMVEVDDEGLSVDTPEDLQIVEAHINGYN